MQRLLASFLCLFLLGTAQATPLFASEQRRPDFLPVDQAFMPDSIQQAGKLTLSWRIAPGYYLYQKQFKLRWQDGNALPVPLPRQAGESHDDPTFGRVVIHRDQVDLDLAPVPEPARYPATLEVRYQGCADAGLCYPPQTWRVTVTAPVPQAPVQAAAPAGPATGGWSERAGNADALASWLRGASLPATLAAFLLLGLGLAFTPCVLPMLPILSAIIAGTQGSQARPDARRGLLLALSYVLGMSAMYTLAGLLITSLGAAANLSALLQKPPVLISFAGLFVLLGGILLSGRDLALPAFISDRLQAAQQRQQGGQLGSVFVMGAISSLVLSPCVSAPLAGVMLYLGSTQDLFLGGAALFCLSMGMGLPLLLLGAGGGRFLPRSGPWLNASKALFGWLLLAVAVSLANRLLPGIMQMLCWAGFFGITALVLLRQTRGLPALLLALALLAWSGLLVWASARGQDDPWHPWRAVTTTAAASAEGEFFQRLTEPAAVDAAVAKAARDGIPVIVDVYADWCVSCVDMARNVLSRADVREHLAPGVRIQFDITATSTAQLDWMQAHQLVGPPAFLFWNARGQAQSPLIGEADATAFTRHLDKAWN